MNVANDAVGFSVNEGWVSVTGRGSDSAIPEMIPQAHTVRLQRGTAAVFVGDIQKTGHRRFQGRIRGFEPPAEQCDGLRQGDELEFAFRFIFGVGFSGEEGMRQDDERPSAGITRRRGQDMMPEERWMDGACDTEKYYFRISITERAKGKIEAEIVAERRSGEKVQTNDDALPGRAIIYSETLDESLYENIRQHCLERGGEVRYFGPSP